MAAVPGLALFLPSPAPPFSGDFVGFGPLGLHQVHRTHWASLYEMGLSWSSKCGGEKGLIEFGLGPDPSPVRLANV
jgi:hypothetical protein